MRSLALIGPPSVKSQSYKYVDSPVSRPNVSQTVHFAIEYFTKFSKPLYIKVKAKNILTIYISLVKIPLVINRLKKWESGNLNIAWKFIQIVITRNISS